MVHRYPHKSVTWYDVLNPTNEEIRELLDECAFPPSFANDLTGMTPRSEAIAEKGAIKVTLDYPIVKRTDIDHPHEIKFIATKKAFITIRFEEIEALHRYAKQFEVLEVLDSKRKNLSGGALLISMLTFLYDGLEKKLDHQEQKLVDIEHEIFNEHEREMVSEISVLARSVITFRYVVGTHQRVLEELPGAIETAFGKTLIKSLHSVNDTYDHVFHRAQALQRRLDELRDTNTALLTTKQNEIMKILTIMAFITFPLTLFTSMFGMNTTTIPLVGVENDFWIISGIMLIVSISFFGFFRYKKWL